MCMMDTDCFIFRLMIPSGLKISNMSDIEPILKLMLLFFCQTSPCNEACISV